MFRIFANDVHLTTCALIGRQTVHDASPGLAAIVRPIDIVLLRPSGSTTTAEADVREHVGRIDVAVPGFDGDEVGVRRQIGEVRDVVPGLAAVHRVVNLSRGAARPYDAWLDG